MHLSIREAKARFSEAVAAAERGERVVITRHGHEVIEFRKPEPRTGGFDFERAEQVARKLGIEPGSMTLPDYFDETWFSRQVLGLDDDD